MTPGGQHLSFVLQDKTWKIDWVKIEWKIYWSIEALPAKSFLQNGVDLCHHFRLKCLTITNIHIHRYTNILNKLIYSRFEFNCCQQCRWQILKAITLYTTTTESIRQKQNTEQDLYIQIEVGIVSDFSLTKIPKQTLMDV